MTSSTFLVYRWGGNRLRPRNSQLTSFIFQHLKIEVLLQFLLFPPPHALLHFSLRHRLNHTCLWFGGVHALHIFVWLRLYGRESVCLGGCGSGRVRRGESGRAGQCIRIKLQDSKIGISVNTHKLSKRCTTELLVLANTLHNCIYVSFGAQKNTAKM